MEVNSLELILKLLQDGKLTVSEAIQLIQDLQSKNNITYVPSYPYYPYRPQVWYGYGTITNSGDSVSTKDYEKTYANTSFTYAKC